MAEAVLACSGLSVRRGGREILHEVSLELRSGEIAVLVGPNGSGKSTLLAALAGGTTVAAGRVERHGRAALGLQSAELARRTALDNVALSLAWWGVPRRERRPRAERALALLGVEQLAGRQARELSGGERRRVHLARLLALEADVLLLDEPFAGLDHQTRGRLLEDTLPALRAGAGCALVVVHDRAEAWALADRLLVLLEGKIAAEGPPRDLLSSPPDPDVARFLGFDGWIEEAGATLLTRPADVILDGSAPLAGTVTRAVPMEDGVRLEVELARGRVYCVCALPAPRPGDGVRVRITGGVRFETALAKPTSAG